MINQYLKEREEEFDKSFVKKPVDWRENHGWTVDYVDSRADKLKQFQKDTILGMLEKMKDKLKAEMEVESLLVIEFDGVSKKTTITEDGYEETVKHSKIMARNRLRGDQILHLDTIINSIREE